MKRWCCCPTLIGTPAGRLIQRAFRSWDAMTAPATWRSDHDEDRTPAEQGLQPAADDRRDAAEAMLADALTQAARGRDGT